MSLEELPTATMDSARSQVIILHACTLVGSLVWIWPEIVLGDYVYELKSSDFDISNPSYRTRDFTKPQVLRIWVRLLVQNHYVLV